MGDPNEQSPERASEAEATARDVALLARLELAPDEAALLGGELARILEAFQTLGRAEVTGVEPLVAPLAAPLVDGLRADVPAGGLVRAELLARAPEASAGPGESGGGEPAFFRVPRAIDAEPAPEPAPESHR